ncbi:FabA-like domain protein [Fictibacillus enclensis]|uniref:3-hydroxyacyl-ACP dehydratase FabZ family protein n=1 Tax=Fictibacillus enclensis TaxID=1017270 RepID=UPI0025A00159|nr:FabA-like domain protein [Fictibacillus enclensis]MDM5335853.1 FabA-like domain protein [Fictibacillus enclensis]
MESIVDLNTLPHQFPFRFISSVTKYVPTQLLIAHYNFTDQEKHFGKSEYVPSSILIEGLAQTAVIFTQLETKPLTDEEFPLLGSVKAKFYEAVRWTEDITYIIDPIRIFAKQALLTAVLYSGGRKKVSVTLSVAIATKTPKN